MKMRITRTKGYIGLVTDDDKDKKDQDVVAAMTLFEGTRC